MENNQKIKITFLGASGTVTGSKYLLTVFGKNILVDCGLFQGLKKLRLLNWNMLPIESSKIDIVLITHGHLDHVGFLPRLVKTGFTGKIFATGPTIEIANIILRDSARIQEEDANRANEEGFSKHKPAKPLYNSKDVEKTIPHFESQPLNKWIIIYENISLRFRYVGHIIGATFIELKIGNKLFVFSGDIGRENDLLLFPPEKPERADILFIESTYGNRIHPENMEITLIDAISAAAKNNGTIIIPSFAVERTQLLMYILWQLRKRNAIPLIPVFMDSPMGKNALEVFHHNLEWHKLSIEDCNEMCKDIISIQTIQETWKLVKDKNSKIVIAGGGMASGGRVLVYFQNYLDDPNASILLVGYQSEGTRGRSLLEGATELKLFGKLYPVKAKTINIGGLSAHADQRELINWLNKISNKPEEIFIIHGEKDGAEGLKNKIKEVYNWNCQIPQLNQVFEINID